ncbi:MAG: hypothetical protein ACM3XS_03395 [Bacteroidota bacterium]
MTLPAPLNLFGGGGPKKSEFPANAPLPMLMERLCQVGALTMGERVDGLTVEAERESIQ